MSLYSQWQELINAHTSEAELRRFWDGYFKAETEAYKKILSAHKAEYAGREEELAQFFGMPAEIFIGFIDGINTSLRSELPLEEIENMTSENLMKIQKLISTSTLKSFTSTCMKQRPIGCTICANGTACSLRNAAAR